MRRRDRYILNGVLIGGGVAAMADIIVQWIQHLNRGEKFTWQKFDGWRTLKWAGIGAATGGLTGYGFYRYKIGEESKLPFHSDEYLNKILTDESLNSDPKFHTAVLQSREKVKGWLAKEFNGALVQFPEDTGSFHKKTAINSNYDLDIILPFSKNSYSTLEEMYIDVFNRVGKQFGNKATVSKQRKAIGLTFDTNQGIIHFDLVPGREIDNYAKEKELNLYQKPDWFWQKGSSHKTNVRIHKSITTNQPQARKSIKLLKAYRERNNLNIPTIIIDQAVVEALAETQYGVSSSISENLLNSMTVLSRKLRQKSFIDLANSNNNLHKKLDQSDKFIVADLIERDIQRVTENPMHFKEMFDVF
ncbi:MAG: hypothetical protein IPG01_13165 [Chitinophagaceae bacterium]|nr:hypothetical protein [Chitinophagaceae bacterium]